MYDIIFIGAGISNLYLANQLKKYNKKMTILEKKGIIGGRIKSRTLKINKDTNIIYELGAQRINQNHKRVLQLIHNLGLSHDLVKATPISQKYNKMKQKILQDHKNSINDTFYSLSIKNGLKKSEVDDIVIDGGYNLILKTMNYNNYRLQYYDKSNNYYYLKNGLSQLVECLSDGLDIRRGVYVDDIKKVGNYYELVTKEGMKMKTKKIVFGIPKENLCKFSILDDIKTEIRSVSTNNFIRIYALFSKNKNGKYWYDGLMSGYYNSSIRQIIIDHNSKYGLIQICYSDGVDAENWKNWIIDGKLEYVLMEELRKIFSKRDIKKPSKLLYQYWWHGTHYTYPTYNSNKIYKRMLNPIENIYIIGECYSKYQGWIEGALQTAEDCSKIILENNFEIEKKNMKKITKKTFDKNKEKWTIYEGHVYDISKFIKKHPGGEVIKYALGIDMTKIFNSVGHNNDSYNILEKYKIGKLI